MVIRSVRPLLELILGLWRSLIPVAVYILIISWLDLTYHFENYNLPIQLVSVPGTVIGLLLAFRTNSAYQRWWQARTIWGGIVNDSHTWVRQLLTFLDANEESQGVAVRQLAYRQVAWCYALGRSLRNQEPLKDVAHLLSAREIDELSSQRNIPNALLLQQAKELKHLYTQQLIDSYQFVELERTLIRLTNSMGGCERIKNTPFPASYSHMLHGLIYLFIVFLPFGLVQMPLAGLIATSMPLAIAFLVIDQVAMSLQSPFDNRPSDTPVLSLSRTIEINVKQVLEETDLPEPPLPVRGILY